MECHNDKTATRCRHAAGPLRLAVVGVWNRWRRSATGFRSATGCHSVDTSCAITAVRTVQPDRRTIADGVADAKRHHERFGEAPVRGIDLC